MALVQRRMNCEECYNLDACLCYVEKPSGHTRCLCDECAKSAPIMKSLPNVKSLNNV